MSEVKEREEDVRLSYSSLGTLQTCEQKFAHRKVYKTPVDPDFEESEALGIGKAFHQGLELTNHRDVRNEDIDQALMDHNVKKHHKPLIIAMSLKAIELNKASRLRIIKCELELSHKDYVGYIDAIGVQLPAGMDLDEVLTPKVLFSLPWWIIDLKSAGQYDSKKLSLLPLDLQLNLYAYFKNHIAGVLGLDPDKFAGCKYRQITKSKATKGANETDGAYIKRLLTPKMSYGELKAPVEARDITIPYLVMNPAMAWEIIQENLIRAREIQQGEAPKKNFKSCMDFFKPCEYFSQCHGHTHTENSRLVKVHTAKTYVAKDVL